MKSVTCLGLASLFLLAACSTMGRPYIDDSAACDDIVDAKERLDCYERADRAESEWRKEKRDEDESRTSKDD
ncbi:MAG: hypothetical protein RIB03_02735 [Henriciella sp.]|mgnify:CR=1 FL=1|uniref:hypothetical protein n=1 Tax=Henriciella sp. TaxID=1968823 RepID=UPI002611D165|nr:hypothetical protein [Henriciella sp.]